VAAAPTKAEAGAPTPERLATKAPTSVAKAVVLKKVALSEKGFPPIFSYLVKATFLS
jgi:hypothetical protein